MNIVDINKNFEMLNDRISDNLKFGECHPKYPTNCLAVRDIRILSDRSIFEEYDAVRKTYQFQKDFINDNDSITGSDIVQNMIKNIMCTRLGSLKFDPDFGVDLSMFLFEQLDWVTVIAIRDHIANQLDTNLPEQVELENIDVRANNDGIANTIDIDITYHYIKPDDEYEFGKPKNSDNLETRKVTFTLGVEGFKGYEFPNKVQHRRAQ